MNQPTQLRTAWRALIVIAALVLGVVSAHPTGPAQVAGAPVRHVRDAQLVSPLSGWALTAVDLARTDDAGASWRSILPPAVAPSSILSVFFLDPLRGWVLARGETILGTPPGATVLMYRTVDGGRTWLVALVGRTAYGHPVAPTLSFGDAVYGWVDWGLEGTRAARGSQLFVTTDGGVTWSQRRSPIPGRVAGTPSRLWIWGVRAGSSELYTSTDLGSSWRLVQLPLPGTHANASIIIDRVLPLDANRATVAVSYSGEQQPGLGIYVTADGGATWSLVADIPTSVRIADEISAATAVPEPGTVIAVLPKGDVAYVTRGGTIAQLAPVGLAPAVFKLSFANPDVGWALTFADGPDNGRLFATRDGARTWGELAP